MQSVANIKSNTKEMTLNLKFDLDPECFRENECHHRISRGRFSLKSMFAAVTNCCLFPPLLLRLFLNSALISSQTDKHTLYVSCLFAFYFSDMVAFNLYTLTFKMERYESSSWSRLSRCLPRSSGFFGLE